MKPLSLTAFVCIILLSSCKPDNHPFLTNGVWKIRKVEIRKNNELKLVIDTGFQYWSFNKSSLIEIFDRQKIQNILHIKIGNTTIKSFDTSGSIKDEFVIEELNKDYLALSSRQKSDDDEYNIIYYLDKIRDSSLNDAKMFRP